MDEDIKISILESICPVEVERHLQLNQARFADYLEVRKELSTYLETGIGLKLKSGGGHSSSDYNGPQPMDIGALAGGDKKKNATCHNCGKLGHYKSECWACELQRVGRWKNSQHRPFKRAAALDFFLEV